MLITHSDIDHTDRWNEYVIARLDLTYTPLQIYIFQMMDLRPSCNTAAILWLLIKCGKHWFLLVVKSSSCFQSIILFLLWYTNDRQISGVNDSVHILTFWYTMIGTISSAILMLPIEYSKIALPRDCTRVFYLLGHVGTSSCALLCYIISMEKLSAHFWSLLTTGDIPISVIMQYVLFKNLQPMDSNMVELAGAIIVTFGLLVQPLSVIIQMKFCSVTKNGKDGEKEYSPIP